MTVIYNGAEYEKVSESGNLAIIRDKHATLCVALADITEKKPEEKKKAATKKGNTPLV